MQRNGYTLGYARSIRQPAGLVSGLLAFGILLSAQGVYSALPAYADPIFPPPAGTVQTPPEAANGLGSLQSIVPTRVRDTRDGIGGASGRARAPSSPWLEWPAFPLPEWQALPPT